MDSNAKIIDDLMGRMTLVDKVGQCLTMNFTGYVISDYEKRFINEFRCGGMRITPHITGVNDEEMIRKLAPQVTAAEYTAVMRTLQEMALERNGIPLHLVTDQEGDLSVDFLRGGFRLFCSNMGMTATNDPGLVRKAFRVIGRQLRAHGINMLHSPELDVNVQPKNPEIGMRAFSDDPKLCAKFGIAAMQGLMDEGIIPTAKHFPGRGDSELDAHNALDVLRVDKKRLDRVELYPYRKLIAKGLPAIMTAHNAYTALDDESVPASVSYKITTGLLREEMGFDGVITTDAIGMRGLLDYAGGQWGATVMALKAGADLVLIKEDEATTARCFNAVMDAVKAGELTEARLDQSVRRILKAKADAGLFADCLPDPAKVTKLMAKPAHADICRTVFEKAAIVTRDRDGLLPLAADTKVLTVEQYIPLYHEKCNDAHYHPGMFSEWMKARFPRAVALETRTPATDEDLQRFRERAAGADCIAVFNTFWRGSSSNRGLIREAVRMGKNVIVATNDLYDTYFLPEAGTVIATFGAVPEGSKIAADIIAGRAAAGGTWPLTMIAQDATIAPGEVVDHNIGGHFEKPTG